MNGAAFTSDAPAPPNSIVRALHALDPGLFLAFSRYRFDHKSLAPLVNIRTGQPILWARWHVMLEKNGQIHHLFAWSDPETGQYAPPDMRIVDKIRSDVARHMTPDQINQWIDQKVAATQERREAKVIDVRDQMLRANKRKIGEVFEGDNMARSDIPTRAPKTFSYGGQTVRRETTKDSIPVNGSEAGFELPDWKKELEGY